MFFRCYYEVDGEPYFLVSPLKGDHADEVICYRARKNEEPELRNSLLWCSYYPIGEPLLMPRAKFENARFMNDRCLNCVYAKKSACESGETMRSMDYMMRCSLREATGMSMFAIELFTDCRFCNEHKENLDFQRVSIDANRLRDLYEQYEAKVMDKTAIMWHISPYAFEWLMEKLEDDDEILFTDGIANNSSFEAIEDYLCAPMKEISCKRVTKKQLSLKIYIAMVFDSFRIDDYDVMYIPKLNLAAFTAVGILRYPVKRIEPLEPGSPNRYSTGIIECETYSIIAPKDIIDGVTELEKRLTMEPRRMFDWHNKVYIYEPKSFAEYLSRFPAQNVDCVSEDDRNAN